MDTPEHATVDALIRHHDRWRRPRFERLWRYFRNPEVASAPTLLRPSWGGGWTGAEGRSAARLAQAEGLPERLRRPGREVVIENDIGWRIHAMVDLLVGRPVRIVSEASDPGRADFIGRLLDRVWEASGGIALLQDVAVLAHVHGHCDLRVDVDEAALASMPVRGSGADDDAWIRAAGGAVRIRPIDPRLGVPLLDASGAAAAYAVVYDGATPEGGRSDDDAGDGRRAGAGSS